MKYYSLGFMINQSQLYKYLVAKRNKFFELNVHDYYFKMCELTETDRNITELSSSIKYNLLHYQRIRICMDNLAAYELVKIIRTPIFGEKNKPYI